MRTVIKTIRDLLVRGLAIFLIAAFALLTLDVLWGVFSRYVLGGQSRWTEEVATYLLVWISLLGAALTYEEQGHLGVDYFVNKLDPAARRLAAIIVEVVVLVFSVGALTIGGWILVSRTLADGQLTPALEWEKGYLYLAAPISGVFFTLFAIEHILALCGGETPGSSGELYNLGD